MIKGFKRAHGIHHFGCFSKASHHPGEPEIATMRCAVGLPPFPDQPRCFRRQAYSRLKRIRHIHEVQWYGKVGEIWNP